MARLGNLSTRIAALPMGLPQTAPYRLSFDRAHGLIRVMAEGDWNLVQTEDFLAELAEMMDAQRRQGSRVRVLVDRSGMPWQSPVVAKRLRLANQTLFDAGDRLAVVVGSSLAKGQMRRLFRHAGSQAFLSEAAAELWLTAWR